MGQGSLSKQASKQNHQGLPTVYNIAQRLAGRGCWIPQLSVKVKPFRSVPIQHSQQLTAVVSLIVVVIVVIIINNHHGRPFEPVIAAVRVVILLPQAATAGSLAGGLTLRSSIRSGC